MGDLRRMLFQGRVAVRVAVSVKRQMDFVLRRFLSCLWRWGLWGWGRFPGGLTSSAEFLPKQRSRRRLTSRILRLQSFELAFQLVQRQRQPQLWGDKQRLDENDCT